MTVKVVKRIQKEISEKINRQYQKREKSHSLFVVPMEGHAHCNEEKNNSSVYTAALRSKEARLLINGCQDSMKWISVSYSIISHRAGAVCEAYREREREMSS